MQPHDMLNEICKVSAIKATAALSKFLKIPIGFAMNPVESKYISQLGMLLGPEEMTTNFFLPITGNLTGASFFLYSKDSALALSDLLLKRPIGTTKSFNDAEISALSEVANILIGNFLTSFAQGFHVESLMHKSATYEEGQFNEILSNIENIVLDQLGNQALTNISFGFEHGRMKGFVIIVFDYNKIHRLLKNIYAIG